MPRNPLELRDILYVSGFLALVYASACLAVGHGIENAVSPIDARETKEFGEAIQRSKEAIKIGLYAGLGGSVSILTAGILGLLFPRRSSTV